MPDLLHRLPGSPVAGPWNQIGGAESSPAPGAPAFVYAQARAGGPLFGPPFTAFPPATAPNFRGQPPAAPGTPDGPPGSAAGKPWLPRVPDPDDPNFNRRMARMTEKLHSMVNSLIAQGQLVQTGQTSWTINPAGGGTGGGTGLTGVFP